MKTWHIAAAAVAIAGCTTAREQTSPTVGIAVNPVTWEPNDPARPQPPIARAVGAVLIAPPADATILFGNQSLDAWIGDNGASPRWTVGYEYMEPVTGTGDIHTKAAFGDVQLHLEFATPARAEGEGQTRGNSGVVFLGKYEVQILDSYGNVTFADGHAGAIYGKQPPLVNASLPPGEWQSFDIIFRAPRLAANTTRPARLTVIQNGIVVQDSREVAGDPSAGRLPITLQNGGQPVRFRNIWVRELTPE